MINNSANAVKDSIKAVLTAGCIAMLAIAVVYFKANTLEILSFVAYIIVYVHCPGALINSLLGIKTRHASSSLLLALYSGWALLVAQYFACILSGLTPILYAIGPCLSAVYVYRVGLSRKKSVQRVEIKAWLRDSSTWLFAFIFFMMLYTMLRTQYRIINPDYAQMTYIFKDTTYHAGIMNSLKDGFPAANPWLDGGTIYYHFFSEILCAVCMLLFGHDSVFMVSTAMPLLTVYAAGLGIYGLLKEFLKRKERAGFYAMCLLLSSAFVTEVDTEAWAIKLTLGNYNYAAFAVAGAASVIIALRYCFEAEIGSKDFYLRNAVVALQIAVLTGIKGPTGLIMVGAMWGTWILGVILKKLKISIAIPLLINTIAFGIVYKLVISAPGTSKGVSGNAIQLGAIIDKCFWKPIIIDFLKEQNTPSIMIYLVLLLMLGITFYTIYFLPAVIGYIREVFCVLSGRKEYDFARVTVYAAFLMGIVLMSILKYNGRSQIYFGITSLMFAPLITGWYFEEADSSNGRITRTLSSIAKAYFIICLVACSALTVMDTAYCIRKAVATANEDVHFNTYETVTQDEYKALKWIKENTPEDCLIAVDRYYSTSLAEYSYENRWDNCFFTYAVYADRNCFFEGAGYNMKDEESETRKKLIEVNNRLYDKNNNERGILAESLGVDYVYVTKRMNDCGDLEDDKYRKVFENNGAAVYEIR